MTGVAWWTPEELARETWLELVTPALDRLRSALGRGAFPPQLLLVGPAGLGRELVAAEVAAMVTCRQGGAAGCACSSCDRARRGLHPDVEVVRAEAGARLIKVEQVRKVVESVAGRPFEGSRRLWIFDGVEDGRLGTEAANAFLKTLEEPPDHVVFLLLAANPGKVLPTIRSRCQVLQLPGPVAIAEALGACDAPPELAAATSRAVVARVASVRAALDLGRGGRLLPLLQLSRELAREPRAFELVAAVALELAARDGDPGGDEELARLAAELLAAEALGRALNLNPERQLLACLLRWQRGWLGLERPA